MKSRFFKYVLSIAILIAPITSLADTEDSSHSKPYLYFSYGKEELLEGKVFEISMAAKQRGGNVEERLSLTILSTEKLSYGIEFGKRYFIGNDLRLFVGGGVFLGEYFQCTMGDAVTQCKERDTSAIYPEFGYMITLKNYRIIFFDRHYYQEQGFPDYNLLGISLGYQF